MDPLVELLIAIAVLVTFNLLAVAYGAESRPGFERSDRRPRAAGLG